MPATMLRATAAGPGSAPPPVPLKPWETHVERRLPRGGWLAVFTEGSSRRVLLAMSGALLITAVVIFPPKRLAA